MKKNIFYSLGLATLLIAGIGVACAAHNHKTVNAPGFRPESSLDSAFLDRVASAKIAVLPTVIRTQTSTSYSETSQTRAVDFLKTNGLGRPEARPVEMDMGELSKGKAQYAWFQEDQKKIGAIVKDQSGADYFLTLEYLIPKRPSGDMTVFGIHVYVLNEKGESAFSFLLNSHHQMLVEAGLNSRDGSEQGLAALVQKADQVALAALSEQVKQAREN